MVITKKNTLMQEYSLNKEQFSDLVQYRKTMKIIMERKWRDKKL